jgi:hypothetical protein
VRVQETLANGVGVLFGVGVTVVRTVIPSPPADGTLNSTAADGSEPDTERERGGIRAVSPETMVA